jgi:predicted transcriptional regulator
MTTEAKLGDLQLKVFDLIRLAGWPGKTCDEIEVETGLTHQSASARINELEDLGHVERRGTRRPTRAGRKAFVYVLKGLVNAEARKDG